jgi:hypothetical protein
MRPTSLRIGIRMGRAYLIIYVRNPGVGTWRDSAIARISRFAVPDVGEAPKKVAATEMAARRLPWPDANSATSGRRLIEMIETDGGGKKGKIARRIIEHAGEQTGAPVKTRITREVEIASRGIPRNRALESDNGDVHDVASGLTAE